MVKGTIYLVSLTVLCTIGSSLEHRSLSPGTQETIGIRIKLPSDVTLHEPIRLEIEVENRSSEKVYLDFGVHRHMAFEFQVTAPDRSTRITRPELTDGGGPVPSFELAPGERYTQRHVLDRWLRFDQVGAYTIAVNFNGRVRAHHPSVAIDSDFGRPVTVHVLPRDEHRLQRRLVSLRNSIMRRGTVESLEAAEELAFFRDPAAVLYLRQAIEENTHFMHSMMDRLVELGTPDARTAVQALASHPDATVARTAAQALTRMK